MVVESYIQIAREGKGYCALTVSLYRFISLLASAGASDWSREWKGTKSSSLSLIGG